jgi:hypothetical protein
MENETMTNYLDEIKKLPEDFDWKVYLIKNVDLILAGIDNKELAIKHYLECGKSEYRLYYEDDKINFFVWCSGKSGSSTLNLTLSKNYFKTIKTHSNEDFFQNNNKNLYDFVNNNKQTNKIIYFIDSYRNPIERKLSSFFQNLNKDIILPINDLIKKFNEKFIENESNLIIHFKTGNSDNIKLLSKQILENAKVDELHKNFIRVNMMNNDNLNILCNVLDKNKESLGIIYFKKVFINLNEHCQAIDELFRHFSISETFTNFDFDKKYGINQYENMVFIKLRFCDIDDWDKILSNIFGKEITMYSDNLSETKEYYELYKEFKDQYKIPKYFIKELLKDEHFNAYNTIEEKRKYIKYWMDRSY